MLGMTPFPTQFFFGGIICPKLHEILRIPEPSNNQDDLMESKDFVPSG